MSKSEKNQLSEFAQFMAKLDDAEAKRQRLLKLKHRQKMPNPHHDKTQDSYIEPLELDKKHDNTLGCEDEITYNASSLRLTTLKQLRKGQIAVQGTVDLHGMSRAVAYEQLMHFLQQAKENYWRCIRIVHGKGSKHAILKNCCYHWLKNSNMVLAIQSCVPKHGGTGAVYVLLRSLK